MNNAFEKKANNRLKEKDLTFSQMSALIEILNMPARKTTFKELEKRLSLAQSTTVGLISRLEQKKLVSVSRDRDDKRIKYVEITSLGEKFCNEARQEMEDTERKLLENLSAGEAETLLSLLKKVNLIIKEL
ncbi:MarR family transcriptional regulator [Anaerotruncus colihominis]|uniref:MarR family winged helix-turn-helix transcriptional regulator n=1 Tax=Anaerotruncus colihominis TaxID=169435 RepID=UPI00214A8A21|nr:MarR family transcriptional regulator [Anaerotruncus colihominis]